MRQEGHERRCLGAEQLGLRRGAGRPGALEEQRGACEMDQVSHEEGRSEVGGSQSHVGLSLQSVMAGTPGLGQWGLSRRFKFGVVGLVRGLEQMRSPLIKE